MPSKWNESDRERQILYDIACLWNLKNTKKKKKRKKPSEYNKTSRYGEQTSGYQWGECRLKRGGAI